jgi:hypothetical protein
MFDPDSFLPNPHDPFQPPARRWLRCEYLLKRGQSPSLEEDVLVQMAWDYCHHWRRCHSHYQRGVLACWFPALAQAHRFWHDATPLQRAELEARLLAGQSDDSIASSCGLSPAAVHICHELFFAVRPHLEAAFYIYEVAIGPKAHQGLRSDDHDVLLKLAGYTLGAPAVDRLLAYFADPPLVPSSLTQLDTPALETLRQKLLVRAWILSLTVPADAASAARLPAVQHPLAQACARQTAVVDVQNIFAPALDVREYLAEPAVGAAAAMACSEVAPDAGPDVGQVIPCLWVRQAVPA